MDINVASKPQAESAPPLFKKRGAKKSVLRKRATTPPPEDSDISDYSSQAEDGRRVKPRHTTAGVATTSTVNGKIDQVDLGASKFSASRSAQIQSTNDATKQSNWFDENNGDDLSSKKLIGTTSCQPDERSEDTYKGSSGYQSFIQRNPNAPNKRVGPIKTPTNIRTITVTDFAPDVCKDYKQTGFCGFGDSCKFLHAREDYKQGWQLDKDWDTVTKGKNIGSYTVSSRKKAAENDDASDDNNTALEGIPFACIICKKAYTNPVTTKCGHYFCETCALQRYRKTPSCAACGAGTNGVFNVAKNLKKLLDKKRERARKMRDKAIENGEEPGDEDEDDSQDEE